MATERNCGLSPVTDFGPICGGRGTCTSNLTHGVCFCDAGWQGECDFQVTTSENDCQINIASIRIAWGLFLCFHVFIYVKYMKKLLLMLKNPNNADSSFFCNLTTGFQRLRKSQEVVALIPCVTIGWWCQAIYALVKIIDQDQKLGSSVLLTVLYVSWRLTFYFACDVFQPVLLSSLLRNERKMDNVITLNYRLSMFHLAVSSAISITVVIPLIGDLKAGKLSIAIFFNVTSISMLFLGIQGWYIGTKVQQILGLTYNLTGEMRMKRVLDKIMVHQQQAKRTGISQFFVYGMFGWIPYFWNKHDYMLPFSWCFVALIINQAVSSTYSYIEKDESTGSRESAATDFKGGNRTSPPAHGGKRSGSRPPRPTPLESTIVATIDNASVYEVDEFTSALLATDEAWESEKKGNVSGIQLKNGS